MKSAPLAFIAVFICCTTACFAQAQSLIAGADISALPNIEQAGGVFRKGDKPADAIKILHDHGVRLFRVRLFVRPESKKSDVATQDLAAVRTLAQRIKSAGGELLLDFHYSDTWADPTHQTMPRDWQGLDFDALDKRIGEYTASVIRDLQNHNAGPEMVQIGNEITAGMLWPIAKVTGVPKDQQPQQWQRLAKLLTTAANAVRSCERDGKKIRIVIHIDGGGHDGRPQYFFKQLMKSGGQAIDFDIIGLSFYPTWNDSLDTLKKNMADLIGSYNKDILLAEVAYPWRTVRDIQGRQTMQWPMSKQGQVDYLNATQEVLLAAPGHHGLGWVWWYPESIVVPDKTLHVWRQGAEALFDDDGHALPALVGLSHAP